MEIRVLSAGKEIGPLSESTIRQYLGVGLICGTDLAIAEGMADWQPLAQLLTDLSASKNTADNADSASSRAVSVRATALTRTKRGPIVLQPMFAGESPATRRSRTGKTAITIEAPRPTTQLPPVAKFVAKEAKKEAKKSPKNIVGMDPLVSGDIFARPTPAPGSLVPTTPPEPDENEPAANGLILEPLPDIPPRESSAEESHDLPRAIRYVSMVFGVLALVAAVALGYLIWHFDAPASHAPLSVASPASADATETPVPAAPHTAVEYAARGYARELHGDDEGALADYNQAVRQDPRNVQALYRRGLARQTKGQWDGALADYNALLVVTPDNADAYSNRGYVKQRLGDLDGALADYTEALSRKPTIAEAFYNIGLIKVRRGDLDGGIEAYNRALDLNPKLTLAYYNRGSAKNAEGDLDGAIADYTQALDTDPANAMAYFNRGLARQTRNDPDAMADYTQAISNDANLAPAYFHRGEIEMKRGEFSAALADSTKAVELDSTETQAYFNRGLAEIGLHDLDSAQSDLAKYCGSMPHLPNCDTARLYLWVITAQQSSQEKADTELAAAMENNWNSSPEDLTSKIASYLVGHIQESELIADASTPNASLEPGCFCKVWYFAGIKRQVMGDAAAAYADFQKSLATGQGDLCEYLFARTQLDSLGQSRQASSQPPPVIP